MLVISERFNFFGRSVLPKLRLTDEEVSFRLSKMQIERIGEWEGTLVAPATFRCLREGCGFIWRTRAGRVLNEFLGCPQCNPSSRTLPTREVQRRLKAKKMALVGEWRGSKGQFYTLQCLAGLEHPEWTISGAAVLRSDVECPNCAELRRAKEAALAARRRSVKMLTKGRLPRWTGVYRL